MSPVSLLPRLGRHSISAKIFAAFVAMSVITAGLGGYGYYVLSQAGEIVARTYDGPLMAINFARSASLLFMQMNTELLRRATVPSDRHAAIDEKIDELTENFFDDLGVARERSLGVKEAQVIGQIKDLVNRWTAARKAGTADVAAELADQIIDRFDTLIELTADHSFVERRKSVWEIQDSISVSLTLTGAALLVSALITLLLARNIIRSLGVATRAANLIAEGDLQARIPVGGRDEAGVLLHSMKVMQNSLLHMMDALTAQREAAEEEKRRAEQASKAKSDFLSNMSHELRTPLNSILGFAQLLAFDTKDALTERQRGHVEQIRKSGDHLLLLIDEVLDLSKIEAGNIALSPEPVPLAPLLERLQTALSPLAAKANVTIEHGGEPGLIVRADGTRLLQVLMNLGNNALKYNRPGGKLSLSAESLDEKTVRIMVVDTGIGIPRERQAEVFQAFNRLGAEAGTVEGTGIGLNITQRLVHLMSGQISFFSTPNVGTAFYVDLPAWSGLVPGGAPDVEPATDEEQAPGRQGYTLLYVEDNPSNIELMQGLVEALDGITLLIAEHPHHGLALAAERRPEVIVLDIDLPDMNGYQVLERLKQDPATAAIPVIALTAAAMPSDIERGLAAGFTHYLTKPINVRDFFATIEDVIGEG